MSRVLDHMAKGLAAATTRRDVLKAVTGALIFGITGCRPEKQCQAFCSSTLGCRCAALSHCMAVCEACPTSLLPVQQRLLRQCGLLSHRR